MTDTITADWTILQDEGVEKILDNVTRSVARQYHELDADDLRQEATIILATKADYFRGLVEQGGLGLLSRGLWQDVTDVARKSLRRVRLDISYDAIAEAVTE